KRLKKDESQSVGQENVRQVQDHPPPGRGPGGLREPEAQAETGLRERKRKHGSNCWRRSARAEARRDWTHLHLRNRPDAIALAASSRERQSGQKDRGSYRRGSQSPP